MKERFCPECAKNGFPETPSMLDSDLCGDCDDNRDTAIYEQQYYSYLGECEA